MQINKNALETLETLAPVDFDQFCAGKSVEELEELEKELEGIASSAAMLAAYIGHRHGGGCGDQGHAKAVKKCNKVLAQVRRAFGYNITHPTNF